MGNGKWYSDKPEVNKITGNQPIEFVNTRPIFSPWRKVRLKFKEGVLNGTDSDFDEVYKKLAKSGYAKSKTAAKKQLSKDGLTPHHLSNTEIELIPTDLHGNVPHIGSTSDMRGGY